MVQPEFQFVPLFAAVPKGVSTTLDVLVRLRVPELVQCESRPPLDLAVVLDASGSMAGEKLEAAKAAARQVAGRLGPTDRMHLITFADDVETLAAHASGNDREAILRAVDGVNAGGSTALHGGWVRGATLLQSHYDKARLSRVLLVSDGQANVGERHPAVIAAQVQKASADGVSTSTMGVGLDFNEELLETMARRGDGEYQFIESPAALPALLDAEVQSLTQTCGRACELVLTAGLQARIVDVLNDLDRTEDGALRLPNLVHGRTVEVLVRLEVLPGVHPGAELLHARLSFDDVAGNRQRGQAGLTLPIVSPEGFSGFTPHPEVLEQTLLLDAARIKRRAIQAMDAGDHRGARSLLSRVLDRVDGAPKTDGTTQERAQLLRLLQTLDHGDVVSTRKLSHAQSYTRQRGRSDKDS